MKYKIIFSYDGSNFYGYAKQPGLKTVQGTIEEKISLILNEETSLSASGRTDKGVHALNQVATFVSNKKIENKSKFLYSLNKLLNQEIYIKSLTRVSENFDVRLDAKSKTYEYLIHFGHFDPLKRKYALNINDKNFNFSLFKLALERFIGKHSFMNFCSKEEDQFDFVRIVYDIKITKKGSLYKIKLTGDGFMRYQVRKIIQTSIEVAKGKIDIDYIDEYLNKKERNIVPFTAEPYALYLVKVTY